MALSKTTQDHDEIQQWAEKRGAIPAEVKGTDAKNQTGILRFCFPGAPHHNDASLREISWDEFFEKFDQNGLELIYQDVTAEGEQSNFNKLIYPEDEHASGHRKASGSTRAKSSHSGSSTSHAKTSGSGAHAKSSGSSSSSRNTGTKSTGTRKSGSTTAARSSGSHGSSKSSGSRSSSSRSTSKSGRKAA